MVIKTNTTSDDVEQCYRLFLRRAPESDAVVTAHLADNPTVWELVSRFERASEAIKFKIDDIGRSFYDGNRAGRVDVETSVEKLNELLDHVRTVWQTLGRNEPYWSVVTQDQYRSEHIDGKRQAEFYSSGRQEIERFIGMAKANGLALPTGGTVIDLGCGVGRLAERLSEVFNHYIGVDISSSHLKISRGYLGSIGRTNVSLELLSDFLDSEREFDALYSVIVLQHNPPPVMFWLLRRLLERLRPGGVAYFQVPCYLYDYEFNVDHYLTSMRQIEGLEMHVLPQRYVHQIVKETGCVLVEMTLNCLIGPIGHSYTFLLSKG